MLSSKLEPPIRRYRTKQIRGQAYCSNDMDGMAMKSVQKMEKLILHVDSLMNEWDEAFETKDWSKVNVLKRQVKEMLDDHYDRNLRGNNWGR